MSALCRFLTHVDLGLGVNTFGITARTGGQCLEPQGRGSLRQQKWRGMHSSSIAHIRIVRVEMKTSSFLAEAIEPQQTSVC